MPYMADLDFYEGEFKASGFRGPLNRYRNHENDFEWLQGWSGKRIEQPALFGHIHHTAPAFTHLFQQFVTADRLTHGLVRHFVGRLEFHGGLSLPRWLR